MKYTIYKLDGKFANHRWWKNYDANNKNLPDIDIETYISGKNLNWTPLLNTKGQPIRYETTNKLNIDEIEIYIDDINNVPDYLKIEFTKGNGSTESAYYYPYNQPNIYNSTDKLSVKVRYVLDRYASYMFRFHTKCINDNVDLFAVRKHENRYIWDSTTNVYHFDFFKQPYYLRKNEKVNEKLIPISKQIYDYKYLRNKCWDLFNNREQDNLKIDYIYQYEAETERYKFCWKFKDETEYRQEFRVRALYKEKPDDDTHPDDFTKGVLIDDMFLVDGVYEYVIVKPQGFTGSSTKYNFKQIHPTSFMIVPIRADSITSPYNNQYVFGDNNTYKYLYEHFDYVFNESNIIGRFKHNLSPSAVMGMVSSFTTRDAIFNRVYSFCKSTSESETFECFLVSGIPNSIELDNNTIIEKIKTLMSNINENGNYLKTKENNPNLLAPQYKQIVYPATSNNVSTLTIDYMDVKQYTTLKLYYDTYVTSEWCTRLLTNHWNRNKLLSQAGNELTTIDSRQAPIECTAWNNAYLQRNILDTGKNNLIKSSATTLTGGGLGLFASILLTLTGIGAPLGIVGAIGSATALAKGGINLSNGLAQIEAQKRNFYEAPDTYNTPIYDTGLGYLNTWAESGLQIYSLSITEQDETIVNNDDNMYGYYVQKWIKYSDYLTCWDGNYMLCDISKNYNDLFKSLKEIDSIFTINDDYINSFLDALNNGITWFDKGEYKNLATDLYNYERIFPRHTNKK